MLSLDQLNFIGTGLKRPECVLVASSGALHVADWRGGVSVIDKTGTTKSVLANGAFKPKPNGIAILKDKGWLLTHLGDEDGGVFFLNEAGDLSPFLVEIDGAPLPPTNYVHVDGQGRAWVTVSTRKMPRILGNRPDCDDGFIVLVDEKGARIVADGLGYTNECLIHPVTGHLYVNETFTRKLTRFEVAVDGSLSDKTTVTEFGYGEFPDGLTFDEDGGVWITSIISNKVIRVSADDSKEVILEDSDPDHLARVEEAYQNSELQREHLDRVVSKKLRNISSLAFGGEDMKTGYLGCLLGDEIATFQSPWAGLKPYHWDEQVLKAGLPA